MNFLTRLDPGDVPLVIAATSAIIIGIAAIGSELIARVARRLSASARHDLYLGALVVIVLSPLIVVGVARSGLVLFHWPVVPEQALEPISISQDQPTMPPRPVIVRPLVPAESSGIHENAIVSALPTPRPEPSPSPAPVVLPLTPSSETPVVSFVNGRAWAGALVVSWSLGCLILLARLLRGMFALIALGRRSSPIERSRLEAVEGAILQSLKLKTLPPIFESIDVPGPLAGGLFRPRVVLPKGMVESLSSSAIRDILIHECAHLLRRDPLVGLLQRLAELMFWPHPLVHRLNRRLARAREEACDDLVVGSGNACGYARTLLQLAEEGGSTGRVGPVVGLFETRWRLEERVARILERGSEPNMKTSRWVKLASVTLLGLASVAVAAVRPGSESSIVADDSAMDDGPGSVITGQVVDEAGKPVNGASVNVTWFRKAKQDARTDVDGRFTLQISGPIRLGELVRASMDGDSRIGISEHKEALWNKAEPVRIVLKPSRALLARVVDAAGKPVEGAAVEVQSASDGPIGEARTDGAGIARFRLPADAKVETVAALKNGVGFDYFENYRSWPSTRRDPLPPEVVLVLDGSTSAKVLVVDSNDKPVQGVELGPQKVEKTGKLTYFNGSGSEIAWVKTDKDGEARFDWLPRSISSQVWVNVHSWNFQEREQAILTVGQEIASPVRVRRNVKLSGKVTNPDGSPARGVLIQSESRGKDPIYGRRLTRSGDDGRYSLEMPPDQVAMIAVLDPQRSARPLTGIIVREGQPRDDLDIRFVQGTRFVANLTDEADGKPIPGAQLIVLIRGIEVPKEFREEDSTADRQDLVTWVSADANGKIDIPLGPGDYTIQDHENLTIDGPGVIRRDYKINRAKVERPEVLLKGTVVSVDGANERPIDGALIRFVTPPKAPSRDIDARAGTDGRFEIEPFRVVEGGLLIARDRAGTMAGYWLVDQAKVDLKIPVSQAATASGRVVKASGKPVVGRHVQLSTWISVSPSLSFRTFDATTTDEAGHYQFRGLIPGTRCEVIVYRKESVDGSGLVEVEKFEVNGPDPITIETIAIPGEPEPIPKAAIGPKFLATDVVGANPMPYAISRHDVEDLIQAIGREPLTPEVLAKVGRVVRPQENWITELGTIRKVATDPRFVVLADRASMAVSGKPADTATLVDLSRFFKAGEGVTSLRKLLENPMIKKTGKPVRGVVVDAATGRGIAGAVVFNAVGITSTDANGSYSLDASSRGNFWVEAEGYALLEVVGEAAAAKVAMAPEAPIVGRVLERDGFKPVDGAIVWAMVNHSVFLPGAKRDRNDSYGFPLTARTDAQGRFAFRGMPAGAELEWFEVQHPRFHLALDREQSLTAGAVETLLVEPGCVVSGEVVDESGKGVPDASIGVRPAGERMIRYDSKTDAEGRYHFGYLPPGRYDLIIEPERQAFRKVAVVADPARPAINQVVVEAGGTIGGKVVDAQGRPIAGASVGWPTLIDADGKATEANQLNRSTYTEEDGTFQIRGLAFGKYQLTAMAGNRGGQVKIETPVNRRDLVITIPVGGK